MLAGLLDASETNSPIVKVSGKRKLEVGLVAPGCFQARTKRKKVAHLLNTEIKIKERYPYFEFEIEHEIISKPLLNTTTAQDNK